MLQVCMLCYEVIVAYIVYVGMVHAILSSAWHKSFKELYLH